MDRGEAECAISIRNSDDSMLDYQCVIRPEQSALKLSNPLGSMSMPASFPGDSTSVFTYSRPDADHLMLQNSQFTISMKRLNPSYPLLTSGPHWIDNGVNR